MSLSAAHRAFLLAHERAVLGTTRPDGRPRLVPICYALVDDAIVSVIDAKPKATTDPRGLARVRDLLVRPQVTLLVDRWSSDWSALAWLRVDGSARLIEPGDDGHDAAIDALVERYDPYRSMPIRTAPVIVIELERVVAWGAV